MKRYTVLDYWSDSNRYRSETHRYVSLTEIRYGSELKMRERERERELTGIGHGDFIDFIGEGERRRRSLDVFFSFLFSGFSYFILILN